MTRYKHTLLNFIDVGEGIRTTALCCCTLEWWFSIGSFGKKKSGSPPLSPLDRYRTLTYCFDPKKYFKKDFFLLWGSNSPFLWRPFCGSKNFLGCESNPVLCRFYLLAICWPKFNNTAKTAYYKEVRQFSSVQVTASVSIFHSWWNSGRWFHKEDF